MKNTHEQKAELNTTEVWKTDSWKTSVAVLYVDNASGYDTISRESAGAWWVNQNLQIVK